MYLLLPSIGPFAQKNRCSEGQMGICQNASEKSNTNAVTESLSCVVAACRISSCTMASKSRGSVTLWPCDVMSLTPLCLVSKIIRALVMSFLVLTIRPSLLRIGLVDPTNLHNSLYVS